MSGSKEFEALGLQEVPSEGDGRETKQSEDRALAIAGELEGVPKERGILETSSVSGEYERTGEDMRTGEDRERGQVRAENDDHT